MPVSQRDVRNRIGSVKNVQRITRALEVVAAARLRRAEQRIEALRPYADARRIAERLIAAYVDDEVDQVEIFYNRYFSALSQEVRRETLLPLQRATLLEEGEDHKRETESDSRSQDGGERGSQPRALVDYEPDPEQILGRLVPDYVEISIYRALLESTASEHGARMTAMRNASQNASSLIEQLTLEMNRARQAEITQEILEVVAGAEGVSG
jgi:F-type H+-transporting ATPase subunit gamma